TYTVGPVGSYPSTQYLSPAGRQGDPFPYNPAKAKELLSSHGWKIVPNGVSTCQRPSLCGGGIRQGQALNFTLPYATGTDWIASEMTQLRSSAATVGIRLNLEPRPFNTWRDYLARQLPVSWQPNGAYQLTEVSNNLRGVLPQSTTLNINPENWYFAKS
ncbi:MAG: ABC transporter substrate-binding protein, partial [Trebonia sp.]